MNWPRQIAPVTALLVFGIAMAASADTALFKKKARIAAQAGSMACMVDIGRVSEAEGYRLLNQNIRKANLEDVADWLMSPKGTYATQLVREGMNSTCTGFKDEKALMKELAPLVL